LTQSGHTVQPSATRGNPFSGGRGFSDAITRNAFTVTAP
jgi:hypothetical protein